MVSAKTPSNMNLGEGQPVTATMPGFEELSFITIKTKQIQLIPDVDKMAAAFGH